MPVPQEINRLFRSLRRKIRFYLAVEGGGLWLFHIGVIFWFSLLCDRFLESSPSGRAVFLCLTVFFLLGDFWFTVLKPIFRPLTSHALAILLERRFPEFDDALLTLVEPERCEKTEYYDEFLSQTREELTRRLTEFRFRPVFRLRPLIFGILGAVLAVSSISGFALGTPGLFHVWTQRFLQLSETPWPRMVQIEIPASFRSGTLKIARGSDVQIRFRAGIPASFVNAGHHLNEVLRTVYFSYRTEDGIRDRIAMERENETFNPNGEWADFTYTFRGVLKSFDFDVTAGDAALHGLRVEVVDSPTAVLTLHLEFPHYTALTPQTLKPGPVQSVPAGTKITVYGESNKSLDAVQVVQQKKEKMTGTTKVEPGKSRRDFRFPLGIFEEDCTLLFTILDQDGIQSPSPIKLNLAVEEDAVPVLEVTPWGIGDAITPNARIPVKGSVHDDFGLKNISFVWQIERTPEENETTESSNTQKEEKKQETNNPEGFRGIYEWNRLPEETVQETNGTPLMEFLLDGSLEKSALDVAGLGLHEKDRFHLSLSAQDLNDREPASRRLGRSQTVTLEVVTPEQLRWRLEGREAVLGQLYDAAYEEVRDSREILETLAVIPEENSEKTPDGTSTEDSVQDSTFDSAQDSEKKHPDSEVSQETVRELQSYRTERIIQNNRKNSHEFNGIAESVENLCLQMVNNRIDSPAWLERLDSGIRQPLQTLHTQLFPTLETTLTELRSAIDEKDSPSTKTLQAKASVQMDAILLLLAQVREKMLKMQDFTEMVELMRTVVLKEEELQREIAKESHSALADLAEEDEEADEEEKDGKDEKKQEKESKEKNSDSNSQQKSGNSERLAERQAEVLRTFRLWEEKIPQMLEMLLNDSSHTTLLKEARKMSDEMRVQTRMETIEQNLQQELFPKASQTAKNLIPDLKKILTKLETENRNQRLQNETVQLREHLKELNARIREQQSLESRTRQARDVQELAKEQDVEAQKTGELARKISDSEKESSDEVKETGEKDQHSQESKDLQQETQEPPEKTQIPPENAPSDEASSTTEKTLSESLRQAQERMDAARKNLEESNRNGAQDEQKKALEELENARARLEQILRQMREEEAKRSLAKIETQLKAMIQFQRGIWDDTKRLDGIPPENRGVDFSDETIRLSRREKELGMKAETLLNQLCEDGRARMMVELLTQTITDMNRVTEFLAQERADSLTISLEAEIIQALEEMLAAVEETEKKIQEEKDSQNSGEENEAMDEKPALIDRIAELKMIRSTQVRIWRRTQTTPPDQIEILQALSHQQEKIRKIVHEMAIDRNSEH